MLILLEIIHVCPKMKSRGIQLKRDVFELVANAYVASSILKLVQPSVKLTFTRDQLMLVIF